LSKHVRALPGDSLGKASGSDVHACRCAASCLGTVWGDLAELVSSTLVRYLHMAVDKVFSVPHGVSVSSALFRRVGTAAAWQPSSWPIGGSVVIAHLSRLNGGETLPGDPAECAGAGE
jgi:hypothetical protein